MNSRLHPVLEPLPIIRVRSDGSRDSLELFTSGDGSARPTWKTVPLDEVSGPMRVLDAILLPTSEGLLGFYALTKVGKWRRLAHGAVEGGRRALADLAGDDSKAAPTDGWSIAPSWDGTSVVIHSPDGLTREFAMDDGALRRLERRESFHWRWRLQDGSWAVKQDPATNEVEISLGYPGVIVRVASQSPLMQCGCDPARNEIYCLGDDGCLTRFGVHGPNVVATGAQRFWLTGRYLCVQSAGGPRFAPLGDLACEDHTRRPGWKVVEVLGTVEVACQSADGQVVRWNLASGEAKPLDGVGPEARLFGFPDFFLADVRREEDAVLQDQLVAAQVDEAEAWRRVDLEVAWHLECAERARRTLDARAMMEAYWVAGELAKRRQDASSRVKVLSVMALLFRSVGLDASAARAEARADRLAFDMGGERPAGAPPSDGDRERPDAKPLIVDSADQFGFVLDLWDIMADRGDLLWSRSARVATLPVGLDLNDGAIAALGYVCDELRRVRGLSDLVEAAVAPSTPLSSGWRLVPTRGIGLGPELTAYAVLLSRPRSAWILELFLEPASGEVPHRTLLDAWRGLAKERLLEWHEHLRNGLEHLAAASQGQQASNPPAGARYGTRSAPT